MLQHYEIITSLRLIKQKVKVHVHVGNAEVILTFKGERLSLVTHDFLLFS